MTRLTQPPMRLLVLLVVLATFLAACIPGLGGDDGVEDLVVTATLLRTANLFVGSEVRVLGLPVGEIASIESQGDAVEVTMRIDGDRDYPADVNARLTPQSLLGERFIGLDPPYTSGPTLQDGDHIPMERTGIPAEVDEVLRSFEDFLSALDGDALADLIDVLSDTLDGNGQGLNELIDSGAQTVRVLADSSVDLNQLVRDLADLNETLATREERIGSTLVNTSQVLRNLQEDRDLLIAALSELERSVSELQPIVSEHGDPLVRDLDTLATTLRTVDRNLERLGTAMEGSRLLFDTAGRAIDYQNARLPLDNEVGALADATLDLLENRLIGLCLRLDLTDCSLVEDLLEQLPDLCLPGLCESTGGTPLDDILGLLMDELPAEAQQELATDLADRQAEAAQEQGAGDSAAEPAPPAPRLPAIDPRLSGRGSVPQEDREAGPGPLVPILPGPGREGASQ